MDRIAYSIDEFCSVAGLGRSAVYQEIREGRLRARKVGRRTVIGAHDARAWLDSLEDAREWAATHRGQPGALSEGE